MSDMFCTAEGQGTGATRVSGWPWFVLLMAGNALGLYDRLGRSTQAGPREVFVVATQTAVCLVVAALLGIYALTWLANRKESSSRRGQEEAAPVPGAPHRDGTVPARPHAAATRPTRTGLADIPLYPPDDSSLEQQEGDCERWM